MFRERQAIRLYLDIKTLDVKKHAASDLRRDTDRPSARTECCMKPSGSFGPAIPVAVSVGSTWKHDVVSAQVVGVSHGHDKIVMRDGRLLMEGESS